MAAPEFVPRPPNEQVRSYRAPEHVPDSWAQDRPSDLEAEQPTGGEFGFQGPDQGYALGLAKRFEGQLALGSGEHAEDAIQGAVLVAMKRASLYGRAPVIHDVEIGLRVWGFLDPTDEELVATRRTLFEGIANPHHYFEAREVVEAVPESTLRMLPAAVAERHRSDWRSLLSL
ncbi:MAG: hypothetical protein AAGA99_10385 [Actinomycetota bacterium]